MMKIATALAAAALAAAFSTAGSAQTATPRDAVRPPEEKLVLTPVPRDSQERRDLQRDKDDSNVAIERDKCGDIQEDKRERCIREATAERDRTTGTRRGQPARGSQ